MVNAISLGYKRINLSIKEEALKLLADNGVSQRKRGEKISELIIEKYAPKPESAQPVG